VTAPADGEKPKPGVESGPAPSPGAEGEGHSLPPRRESFLSRYPRNFKLGVAGVILLLIAALWFSSLPDSAKDTVKLSPVHTKIQSDDRKDADASAASTPNVAGTTGNAGVEILNQQDDRSIKMSPAPDMGLSEDRSDGSLPRISEDGRQPWQVYARPFNTADKRPRIAIVIVDMGLSRAATDAAISRLPANVTLAFDSQSPVIGAWCARARQDGHETLLMVPMEPFDYPRSDPGPNTLLTNLPNSDNLQRLYAALREATGYVGVTTLSGSRFTTSPEKLATVLDVLHQRGLMIFDARVAPHSAVTDMAYNMHVPAAAATARIDANPSPEAIDAALDQLAKTARLTGRAVGIAAPLPVVLDRLQVWLKDLPQNGIALAPISAMTQ
jgi:polysaccharide deacetylase 2 family uncharacterized protein YibQ